jgi:hypothetical protein
VRFKKRRRIRVGRARCTSSGDGLDVHCMVDGSMCVVVDRVVKKVTQLAGAQLKM